MGIGKQEYKIGQIVFQQEYRHVIKMIFNLQTQPRFDCIRDGQGHNEYFVSLTNIENISLKKYFFDSYTLDYRANHLNRRYLDRVWLLYIYKEIQFGKCWSFDFERKANNLL